MNNRQYSDEEILAARAERDRRKAQKEALGQSIFEKFHLPNPPEGIRNVGAGFLQSIKGLGESFPDLSKTPGKLGEIYQKISPKTEMDPYKMMGVKEQPLRTIGGLEQTIGEYGLPAYGVGKGIAKGIAEFPLRSKNIAKNIAEKTKNLRTDFNKLYDNLWKETKKSNAYDMSISKPDIDFEKLKDLTPGAKTKLRTTKEFLENPTAETAHHAKSDLNKIKEKIEKQTTFQPGQNEQYKMIGDVIDKIEGNMFKDIGGKINPELLNKYNTIQNKYAEAIPYLHNLSIKKYTKGKLLPEDLLKELQSNKEFMALKGKEHPEFGRQKLAKDIGNILQKWTVPGLIGTALVEYLMKK